jgi:hypothetical protein
VVHQGKQRQAFVCGKEWNEEHWARWTSTLAPFAGKWDHWGRAIDSIPATTDVGLRELIRGQLEQWWLKWVRDVGSMHHQVEGATPRARVIPRQVNGAWLALCQIKASLHYLQGEQHPTLNGAGVRVSGKLQQVCWDWSPGDLHGLKVFLAREYRRRYRKLKQQKSKFLHQRTSAAIWSRSHAFACGRSKRVFQAVKRKVDAGSGSWAGGVD